MISLEPAIKQFIRVSEMIEKQGVALDVRELRTSVDNGIDLLVSYTVEDANRKPEQTDKPAVITNIAASILTRAEVWLRAWVGVAEVVTTPESATKCADACLSDFDKRFPKEAA